MYKLGKDQAINSSTRHGCTDEKLGYEILVIQWTFITDISWKSSFKLSTKTLIV